VLELSDFGADGPEQINIAAPITLEFQVKEIFNR
jgi:hypothetical protein